MPSWKKMITSGSNARLNSLVLHSGSLEIDGGGIIVYEPGSIQAHSFEGIGLGGSFIGIGHIGSGANLSGSFSGSFQGDGSNLTGIVAGPSVSASYAATASYHRDTRSFGITIDGGGSTITTGIKGDIVIPFNGRIQSWQLVSDQTGDIVIDVWKTDYASYPPTVGNTIAGTEKPTLSSQNKNRDNALSTWTTSVSSGDIVRFNVDSVSLVTRINLVITAETS